MIEYGDPTWLNGEILRSLVGSGVHGIAIEGLDDRDEMGVYMPPRSVVLGVLDYRDDYTFRTRNEGERSGPGDLDLVSYSLRKYLRLALKGNPTALLPLFAPEEVLMRLTPLGRELRSIRNAFLSERAIHRFLGYHRAQLQRITGERGGAPNRPELVQRHGYDTKYASHALRLVYQAYEIATTGHLTLPMSPMYRDAVLEVKRGEVPKDEVIGAVKSWAARIQHILDRGAAVPYEADYSTIDAWAVDAQVRCWRAPYLAWPEVGAV